MTTRITKAVSREICVAGYVTPMIITLTAAGVTYRFKGSRTTYLLPHGLAFQRAATLEADRRRSDRGGARGRRASRGLLAVGGAR